MAGRDRLHRGAELGRRWDPALPEGVVGAIAVVRDADRPQFHQSRAVAEQREKFREAAVGEPFFEGDPMRMCKMIKQTRKQCLGFKILAAGRATKRPDAIEQAFCFACENTKPNNCLIVGTCSKCKDEVAENAGHTLKCA